ncbi:MAG TPA: hypothetical protein VF260_04435 [Bacilli bacterium]
MYHCSHAACRIGGADKLAIVDDGHFLLLLCASHRIQYAAGEVSLAEMRPLKSMFARKECEICGRNGVLFADDMQLLLCQNHLKKLLLYQLAPGEFRLLAKKYGRFPLISEQYYTPWGIALQPLRAAGCGNGKA